MKNFATSVGKITGKTIKTLKEAPSKTNNKLSTAKEQFVSGFRSEIPTTEIQKIGDVEANVSHQNTINITQ
jgi:hypothetical protein